jgi:hyperosmotically inducible periplasmic protein
MRTIFPALVVLALAGCGDPPPPPKPAAPPAPLAAAPQAQAPEAKAPEAPKPDPNKELAARVKRALESERKIEGAAGIDVTAADGVITLWGTAATADQRGRAAQVAAKVGGVKSVENKLQVVKGS